MTIRNRIVRRDTVVEKPHKRRGRTRSLSSLMDGRVVEVFDAGIDTPAVDLINKAPRRMSHFRDGEYIHVSDLIGKCVRKIALADKYGHPMPSETLSHSMALTFAQGDAIHEYVKSRYVETKKENLYGRWSCLCGDTVVGPCTGDEVPSDACERCGAKPHKYEELLLHHEGMLVVASPDVTLFVRRHSCLHPVEIKSINPKDWDTLTRPKPEHLVQVLWYWKLLRDLGYSITSTVSILYATKGFVFKGSPFKEFVIEVEPVLHYLDDYIEDAEAWARYKKTGELPPRVRCPSNSCPEAKKCHVVLRCFDD